MTDAPLNDDLFGDRLSEMLRGLNGETYETDAAIEAQLDAVAGSTDSLAPSVEPLTDDEAARILHKTRELIRQLPAIGADQPVTSEAAATACNPSQTVPANRVERNRTLPLANLPSVRTNFARRISLAGVVLALLLTLGSLMRQEPASLRPEQAVASGPALKLSSLFSERRTSTRPRVAASRLPEVTLRVGESVATGPRERLRVGLPDGSIAFVNGGSSLTVNSPRRLSLPRGEAFFEVQPVTDHGVCSKSFVVQTLDRAVTAVGTKFAVKASDDEPSRLVVTQGTVRVPNVEPLIAAGQEVSLLESESSPQASRRASEVLGWTRELMAEAAPEIVPESEHRGGSITVVDPNGQEMKLSLRKFHVDVHVEDGFARTTIDQAYFNHTDSRQEGTFHFPLPPDASLSRLAMYVNGKLMEGGMVARDHGRNVYEQIRHTRRDPALLEWVDGSTFKMRVFPLEARQEKRIVLSYTQRLPKNYGRTTYRFPAGHTMEGVDDWSTRLRIVNGESDGLRWFSPSHLLRVNEPADDAASASDLILTGAQHNAAFDRDLVIELEPADVDSAGHSFQRSALGRRPGRSASRLATPAAAVPQFTTARADGSQYLLLRYEPELPGELTRPKRNWVFVVETSADRNEVLRNAQREVLRTILDNAEHDDTFALVVASTRSSEFRAKPVFCTAENAAAALSVLDETPSLGALDLAAALTTAERFCRSEAAENWVVHVGSGVGVIGRRDEQTLRDALPRNARYAGIGVGHRWNRAFMRDAASRTGGHFTQINPDEEVSWRAFEFLSAINAPRLLDLKVTSDRKDATFLTFAETIAHGQEIAVVTRFKVSDELPKSITLTGTVDGDDWTQTFPVDVAAIDVEETQSHYLPRIWAKLEIDRLVAAGAEQHRSAITELSRSMYVMSPFTSLLVLEDEAMYEQFKVDRGRKDHWALYPAPEKIDVVYEPGQVGPQPVDSLEKITVQLQVATGERDSAQSNLQTAETSPLNGKQLATLKSQLAIAQSKVDRLEKYREALQKLRDNELLNAASPIVQRQPTWRVHQRFNSGSRSLGVDRFGMFGDAGIRMLGERRSLPVETESLTRWALPSPSATPHFWGRVPLGWRQATVRWDDDAWGSNSNVWFETVPAETWEFRGTAPMTWFRNRGGVTSQARSGPAPFFDGRFAVTPQMELPVQLVDQQAFEGDFEIDVSRLTHRLTMTVAPINQDDFVAPMVVPRFSMPIDESVEYESLARQPNDVSGFDIPMAGFVNADADFAWPSRPTVRRFDSGLPQLAALRDVRQQVRREFYFSDAAPDADRDELFQFRVATSGMALREQGLSRRRRFTTSSWGRQQFAVPSASYLVDDLQTVLSPALGLDRNGDQAAVLRSQLEGLRYVPADGYAIAVVGGPRAGMISDPVERCPGMNTWAADRRAAIEAAAEKEGLIVRGQVSPEAAKLIERVRSRGWETVTLKPANDDPQPDTAPLSVVVNGAGQFRIERSLLDGLQETVICDGESLWHLYPDFAIGARRNSRLIADSILQSLIPWYVADAATLSRGANVDLVNEHTLRITPLVNEERKANGGYGKKLRLLAIELVVDDDARLIERRLVETESDEVLQRQEYRADGSVVWFVGGQQLDTDETFQRVTCEAPSLKPDSEFFAILPLPYRAVDKLDIPPLAEKEDGHADFSKLSQADALKLIAAYFATGKDTDMYQVMEQCFFAKGDYPLGFATLLHSKNPREVTAIQTATSRHPNHPLSQYLRQAADWNQHGNPAVEFTLPDSASRYLKMIQSAQNIFARWSSGAVYRDRSGTETATQLSRDLATITELENASPIWFLLHTISGQMPNVGDAQSFLYRKLASTVASLEERPGQYVSARAQRVKWLLKAGADDEAATLYGEFLLREADSIAQRGGVVLLDAETHESLNREKWIAALRAESARLIEKKAQLAVIPLAEACLSLEETELADELFASVFDPDELLSSPHLAAAALPFLTKRSRHAEAEECFRSLLSHRELVASVSLWRHASTNAKQLGDLDEAARRLEHALQLEFDRLPEQINVEQFRSHYSAAFDLLDEAVAAAQQSDAALPGDLVSRVRELASRWRSIDADATQPCFRTARLLSHLGLPFDAWDYWTSPLADVPNSSGVWSSLAQNLGSQNLVDRASMAWDEAFAWESTNPDYLLNHATLLRQHGQTGKANSLLRLVAGGQWQPRFEQTKRRAGELLRQTQ